MFWDTSASEDRENYNLRMAGDENCCDIFTMDSSFTEKENTPDGFSSPTKLEGDLSMFEAHSNMSCDNSPAQCSFSVRRPLEDLDNNSQDSGYSACESSKYSSPKSRGLSFGSFTSMDEAFLDISELEQISESPKLPGDFNKLITGPLAKNDIRESPKLISHRAPFRRAWSMVDKTTTPSSSRVRSCLFKENQENEVRNFKRPDPPSDLQSPSIKKIRINSRPIKHVPAKTIFRSISATEDSIKSALHRSSTEPDLVGDFSKPFCLPLIAGKHQDLKSISATTLSKLLHGEFTDRVASFKVIDCRYPYEFKGGHITGAQNLYTKQQIIDELINSKCKNSQPEESENHKRDILVFHCEFSSERGPNLSRYLRNIDRSQNKDYYPFLHYPEIYLLDGGYKNFYETYSDLCAPDGYLPMLHPDHEQNLRLYRAQSKTFNADSKSKSNLRSSSFKRL